MKIQQQLLMAIVASTTLLIGGCTVGGTGSSLSKNIQPINHVQFNLPKQIQWANIKNNKTPNGDMIAEWVPKGFKSSNSPVRVVYQRTSPAKQPNVLLTQVSQPLKAQCTDVKNTPQQSKSQHSSQASAEVICAQMGKNGYGLVTYTTIFADNAANHVVVSEIKTLPSQKAGLLTPKNAKEKKQIQNTQALIGVMRGFMDSVRVCDANKQCR